MKAQATFLMTILAASLSATAQEQAADFAENPSALSVLAQEQATVAEKQPEEQTAPVEEQAAPVEEQAPAAEEQPASTQEEAPAADEQKPMETETPAGEVEEEDADELPPTVEATSVATEEKPQEEAMPAEQPSGQLLSVEDQIAAQEKLAAEQQQEQPEDNKAAAAMEDAIQEDDVDEIDLEEDDSAIAAKKPQIKGAITEGTMSLVDIECDEATLADILRQFRKTTGANIISGDSTNLQRRVSVSLKRVPWLEGLAAILGSRGFRLEPRDNIYRVIEDEQVIPVSTRTFTLNHASAKELSELFNATYAPKDQNGKVRSPIASSFAGANVVVVTASDKILSECEAIIKAVDKAVAQIYIEARFIELSSEAMHKLGMQWNSLESWGASVKNINGGWEYNNGRASNYGTVLSSSTSSRNPNTNVSVDGEGKTTTSTSTSQSESKTYTGLGPTTLTAAPGAARTAENMAWHNARGFSGQLSLDDFRLALSAFETLTDAKMFSNPKIIVSNGREAKVDMTTKYPNVTIDSNYTGRDSQNLSISTKLDVIPGEDKFMFAKEAFFSWGIELSVTPRISPDGLISVEIVPTISQCTGYVEPKSNQDIATPYTQYPIIEVKRLTTEFTMKDGATAVIGGLSKTTEEDVDSGIPYLRKIPWIGPKLFGWKSRQKDQKEIIVFVTIGIANPEELPRDIGLPKNAILGREFVRGNQLEPGDREGAAMNVLQLDMKPLEEQKKGTVTITPAQ